MKAKIELPKIYPNITRVEYVKDYTVKILFENGHENIIDYSDYILYGHDEAKQYSDIEKFKNDIVINYHTLAWSDNWHMCFDFKTIYSKSKAWVFKKAGRPLVEHKKVPVRIMVRQSVIDNKGGIDKTKDFLMDCLENKK